MLSRNLALVLGCLLVNVAAQTPAGTSASATSKSHKPGPYADLMKTLPTEKKKPFMELMKKLRAAKQLANKEEKKKQTIVTDTEVHKLLGEDYKKYRAIQESLKAAHAAHSGEHKAAAHLPPPPPPPPPAASTGKKKKGGRSGKGKGMSA